MEKTMMTTKVCVTGASGYVASWLVKLLLHRGYTVNATVRNLNDESKVGHLMALEGGKERLQLFQANLIEQGSFDAAVYGCDGVFHTASPVILDNVNDPQVELIEPAVKGTLNVLISCTKAPSVKRVVLTSSMASVMANGNPPKSDLVDETWFSDPLFCQQNEFWYVASKTLAEEAAMKFAEENGVDLIVINPGFVIGPLLQPTLNVTSECFLEFTRVGFEKGGLWFDELSLDEPRIGYGKSSGMPDGLCVLVDVRDVADAHVLAFENPSANGRYCLVATTLSTSEAFNTLIDLYPKLEIPKSVAENELSSSPIQVSKEKAKNLGVKYIPIEQSLKDTVESLKERNLISFTV